MAGFHEERLILGNFLRAQSGFAYSVINSPFDFSMRDGTAAYDGWRILSHDQGEAVHHIVSEQGLYFFCAGGEYAVDQDNGETLGRAILRHGSDRGVMPRGPPVTTEEGRNISSSVTADRCLNSGTTMIKGATRGEHIPLRQALTAGSVQCRAVEGRQNFEH
jgi:hypothetical protein